MGKVLPVLGGTVCLVFLLACGDDDGGGGQSLCGNGHVEDGETCDDGNNFGGDGCAANCTDEDERTFVPGPGSQAVGQLQNAGIPFDITGQFTVTTGQPRDETVLDADGNQVTAPGEVPVTVPADQVAIEPIA